MGSGYGGEWRMVDGGWCRWGLSTEDWGLGWGRRLMGAAQGVA